MTERTQSEALVEYWRAHVETWRSGSESQAAYCKVHDLVYHRFVYWRRKFDANKPASAHRKVSGGFAKVIGEPAVDTGLSLSLPNGLVLRGINATNMTLVRPLLEQL